MILKLFHIVHWPTSYYIAHSLRFSNIQSNVLFQAFMSIPYQLNYTLYFIHESNWYEISTSCQPSCPWWLEHWVNKTNSFSQAFTVRPLVNSAFWWWMTSICLTRCGKNTWRQKHEREAGKMFGGTFSLCVFFFWGGVNIITVVIWYLDRLCGLFSPKCFWFDTWEVWCLPFLSQGGEAVRCLNIVT